MSVNTNRREDRRTGAYYRVMLTQVSIHASLVLNTAKAWMPTCVGMTSLDRRQRVSINGVW